MISVVDWRLSPQAKDQIFEVDVFARFICLGWHAGVESISHRLGTAGRDSVLASMVLCY